MSDDDPAAEPVIEPPDSVEPVSAEPVDPEDPRRYPSTIGGAFYLLVLGVVGVALVVVSVALVRLLGVPTTVQALPGIRDDAPHELSFRLADRIVAAWPDWVALPAHLAPSAERVHRVGGISRFEGRALSAVRGHDAAILLGRGGQDGRAPCTEPIE